MAYPLDTWWFWVFIAPEAVLFVGWLVVVVLGLLGFGVAAGWRRIVGRRSED